MADAKISALPASAGLVAADLLAVVDDPAGTPATQKATLTQVLTFIQNNQTTMLNLSGSAFTIVGGSSSEATNGTNLVNAYTTAKAATPHGAAKSTSNRYTIFLLPGRYSLTGGALNLDAEFIDLVGLSDYAGPLRWNGAGTEAMRGDVVLVSTGNTLTITATGNTDIALVNLCIETSGVANFAIALSGSSRTREQWRNLYVVNSSGLANSSMSPNEDFPGMYDFCRSPNSGSFGLRTTAGSVSAGGIFIRCWANAFSFGANVSGTTATATGLFIDCEADGASFGTNGASGIFIRCRFRAIGGTSAGMFAYASGADASGTFLRCDANADSSFGFSNASGTFRHCTAGGAAFAFSGTASGLFEYCSCVGAAGTNSFGGPTSNGTFRYCEVTNGIGFGASATASGTFEHCRTSSYGFGGWSTTGGTFSGTARNCSAGNQGFGMGATGAGTLSGTVENCAMGGHGLVTLTGKVTNMRIEATAANTTALQLGSGSTGAVYNSTIVGTGTGLSIDVISGTPTVKIAHCRLNKGIGASVTNAIATPFNVDDTDVI